MGHKPVLIPLAILQPPFIPPACLREYLPMTGPWAYVIRLIRLEWILLISTPLIFIGGIINLFGGPGLPTVKGRNVLIDTVIAWTSCLIFSATYGMLDPAPDTYAPPSAMARGALRLSVYLFGSPNDQSVYIESEKLVIPPAKDQACLGVLKNGFGDGTEAGDGHVKRKEVVTSWLWREGGEFGIGKESRKIGMASEDEKVLVYFVGGGYVAGSPLLGPFAYSILRRAPKNTRVLTVDYRLATEESGSFPGALMDALACYIYLVDHVMFKPENIVLVGSSAGGGLAWSLISYLSILQETISKDELNLGVPGKVALISPWLDLSLSQPSLENNIRLDILNYNQMVTASERYLTNIPTIETGESFTVNQLSNLLDPAAFASLGKRHPLFSPAPNQDPTSKKDVTELVSRLLVPLQSAGTTFFIHHGLQEAFDSEIKQFTRSLESAGIQVSTLIEPIGWHTCAVLFSWEETSRLGRYLGYGGIERRFAHAFETYLAN
ncbi:Arylacetamide deacetylase [Phaffia rhodozyma]|uniref:Arylacetamide deacetylase n=1 Tax=Phaffia rhodozyma TaxID=264483 RepID=A0A0F7SKC2_PHARH|nr:Arylacetamide deacetylase [Phaffia rhodozyma]